MARRHKPNADGTPEDAAPHGGPPDDAARPDAVPGGGALGASLPGDALCEGGVPADGPHADFTREMELLIRSRYAIVLVESVEEARIEGLLQHVADRMNLMFFIWRPGRGLHRADREDFLYGTMSLAGALAHIDAAQAPGLYHVQGAGDLLGDTAVRALLASLGRKLADSPSTLVLTGMGLDLPATALGQTATLTLPPPDREEFKRLLLQVYRDVSKRMAVAASISREDLARLLDSLKGLTRMEAEKVLTKALVEDGMLTADDIRKVFEAKKAIVRREGLLEYTPAEEAMTDVADLTALKRWLAQRKAMMGRPEQAEAFGLSFPKGILLLGVPGTGKSLCAKAVATEWGLPLLRMDPAGLYNKYIGETEKNFRRATAVAERVAPVVLWIDEIEKAFAEGQGEDGGVSTRVLGHFLSWMQERRGDVFVVATANDVTRLPPEFLRKGRFDEVFFLDLPDAATRAEIFRIHLARRRCRAGDADLAALAEATPGFSGAEIEQVIVSALHAAFAEDERLSLRRLLNEARRTRPLSTTRAEYVQWLRDWARDRVVPAN
jgi:MoxR-like ATPase